MSTIGYHPFPRKERERERERKLLDSTSTSPWRFCKNKFLSKNVFIHHNLFFFFCRFQGQELSKDKKTITFYPTCLFSKDLTWFMASDVDLEFGWICRKRANLVVSNEVIAVVQLPNIVRTIILIDVHSVKLPESKLTTDVGNVV